MLLLLLHTKNQLLFMSSWSKCEIPKLHLASTEGAFSTGSFRPETELREGQLLAVDSTGRKVQQSTQAV